MSTQLQLHRHMNIVIFIYFFYIGLNAPLFRRHDEQSIFGTLNINATVSYWHEHGLDKNKIIIGLPTYGHSFRYVLILFVFSFIILHSKLFKSLHVIRLVNPLNAKLGSPASGYGRVGQLGKW